MRFPLRLDRAVFGRGVLCLRWIPFGALIAAPLAALRGFYVEAVGGDNASMGTSTSGARQTDWGVRQV